MRTIIALLMTACLMAAESDHQVHIDGLPGVPNPYGFDDRLALRIHLEENFAQHDLNERSFEELVALYRTLITPASAPIAPAVSIVKKPENSDEPNRRDDIILQLKRQYHSEVDETLSTAALDLQLRALINAEREARDGSTKGPEAPSPTADPAKPDLTKPITTAAPAKQLKITPLDLTSFSKPAGMVMGVIVEYQGNRLVGVSFNASLNDHLMGILGAAAGSMAVAKQAKNCLVLLGHGDGLNIGVGENPVNLTDHLKANRGSYHAALGTEQIECVAILSCSRQADSQFTAFRDGLGYYPIWRISSWEHTYQNAISGLSALQLALAQDRNANFRAVVFADEQQTVGSLSEVGQRAATVFFSAAPTASGMVLTPARRR